MTTITIVDDDVSIGDMLERVLKKEGYQVLRAYSGTEALLLLEKQRPDLILLDLMLPGMSGEELLPHLAGIPVIAVSAKTDVTDRVEILLQGAADYLAKPFDIRELLARITVQLRKQEEKGRTVLSFEGLKIDFTLHEVSVKEVPVRLTRTEYGILRILMEHPGQVVTKSRMLDLISADSLDCMESSLKVHVSNLRKKLREADGRDYIEAVWGIGFKLRSFTIS
ncbi:MAG: response regulator transcription factor [Roseburia sp.]|jgi:two-component system OmpR family response regulator|nr:response regulator transcription factor [Roseburia sp.]